MVVWLKKDTVKQHCMLMSDPHPAWGQWDEWPENTECTDFSHFLTNKSTEIFERCSNRINVLHIIIALWDAKPPGIFVYQSISRRIHQTETQVEKRSCLFCFTEERQWKRNEEFWKWAIMCWVGSALSRQLPPKKNYTTLAWDVALTLTCFNVGRSMAKQE